jgi:Rad3-related DNA helicase
MESLRHAALPPIRPKSASHTSSVSRRREKGLVLQCWGGAFGEAIDLPGERLTGAFIATLGLPQVNSVNEQIGNRMSAALG